MSELDIVRSFYGANIESTGPSFPALGWFTPETQRLRFEVFTLLGDFSDSQILDAGCGLGDCFCFLTEKKYQGLRYDGVDVMPEFIAEAQNRFKAYPDAHFQQQHWDQWLTPVDWVLCSGSLNLKQVDPYAYAKKQLSHFLKLARKGVAVNFLSGQHRLDQQPRQLRTPHQRYHQDKP